MLLGTKLSASGWRRGKTRSEPVLDTSRDISIVIPAYHEEGRLGPTLDRILDFVRQHAWDAEVIGGWRLAGSYRRHGARLCQESWDCPPAGDAAKPRQGLLCSQRRDECTGDNHPFHGC